ncbi:MAG: methyl-accepting chemotaxis protein, partial [Treponema sp.]|nr:methyl-accepting chemotaxis protein [Treponema sp.]
MEKEKNNKRKILTLVFILVAVVALLASVLIGGRMGFRRTADEKLTHAAQLKTLEFQSSLTGELTLVRQMIRSPSIADYLEDPDDPVISEMAMKEFSAYQNSFISNSLFWVSDKNMIFYSDMQAAYTVDADNPDNYWYKMTMYETEEYNFNINYNPDLNVTMLWVNAVVRNKAGTPVGIAGTGIPLTDFIAGMYTGLDDSIEMYMFNDDLGITGAKDQSILADNFTVIDKMPELKNTDPKAKKLTVYHGTRYEFVLAPMDLINWHLAMGIEFGVKEFFTNALTPFVIALVVLFIVMGIIIFSSLIANLSTLKNAVDNLSSGNADLTQRVVLKNSAFKVIDTLGESVNGFIKKLQDIMVSVKDTNNVLVQTGNKLKNGTSDTAASITQIIS